MSTAESTSMSEEQRLWAAAGFGDPYAMAQADQEHAAALEGAITGLARKAAEHSGQLTEHSEAIGVLKKASGLGAAAFGAAAPSVEDEMSLQISDLRAELTAFKEAAGGKISHLQRLIDCGGGGGGSKAAQSSQREAMGQMSVRIRKVETAAAAQAKAVQRIVQSINAESAMDDVIDSIDLDKMMSQVESGEIVAGDIENSKMFANTLKQAEKLSAASKSGIFAAMRAQPVSLASCFCAWMSAMNGERWLNYDAKDKPLSASGSRGNSRSQSRGNSRGQSRSSVEGFADGMVEFPMPSRGSSRAHSREGKLSGEGTRDEEKDRKSMHQRRVEEEQRLFAMTDSAGGVSDPASISDGSEEAKLQQMLAEQTSRKLEAKMTGQKLRTDVERLLRDVNVLQEQLTTLTTTGNSLEISAPTDAAAAAAATAATALAAAAAAAVEIDATEQAMADEQSMSEIQASANVPVVKTPSSAESAVSASSPLGNSSAVSATGLPATSSDAIRDLHELLALLEAKVTTAHQQSAQAAADAARLGNELGSQAKLLKAAGIISGTAGADGAAGVPLGSSETGSSSPIASPRALASELSESMSRAQQAWEEQSSALAKAQRQLRVDVDSLLTASIAAGDVTRGSSRGRGDDMKADNVEQAGSFGFEKNGNNARGGIAVELVQTVSLSTSTGAIRGRASIADATAAAVPALSANANGRLASGTNGNSASVEGDDDGRSANGPAAISIAPSSGPCTPGVLANPHVQDMRPVSIVGLSQDGSKLYLSDASDDGGGISRGGGFNETTGSEALAILNEEGFDGSQVFQAQTEQMLADTFEQLTELRRTLGELDGATMRRFAGIEMREDDLSQQIALLRGDGNEMAEKSEEKLKLILESAQGSGMPETLQKHAEQLALLFSKHGEAKDAIGTFDDALERRAVAIMELFETQKAQWSGQLADLGDDLKAKADAAFLADLEKRVKGEMENISAATPSTHGAKPPAGTASAGGQTITANRLQRQLSQLRNALEQVAQDKGLVSSHFTCLVCSVGQAAAGKPPQRTGFKPLVQKGDHAEVIMKGGFPMKNPKAKKKKKEKEVGSKGGTGDMEGFSLSGKGGVS